MFGNFFAPLAIKIFTGATVALALAAALLFSWWQAADARADLNEERFKNAQATIVNMELDRAISDQAGVERAGDDARTASQVKELDDAINAPGDSPSDSRLRSLCVLKRQQDGGVERLPSQCSRFDFES